MCISASGINDLNNLHKYKYQSQNKSIVYNYVISPALNQFIKIFPPCIAPNLLTILSFVMNIISLVITFLDAGNNYSQPLTITTCWCQFIFHSWYVFFDNLDGKQARKTGTSSPYGMILDHGCDTFTNVVIAFNMAHLLMLGNSGLIPCSLFISQFLGFYATTYEEYVIGYLSFGYVNGADEGNVIVCLASLLGAIFGPSIYSGNVILFISIGIALGSWQCVFNAFIHIYQKNGFKGVLTLWIDWLCFYIVIALPIVLTYLKPEFFSSNLTLIMFVLSFVYGRQTLDWQVKIILDQKINYGFAVICANIALIASLFVEEERMWIMIYGWSLIALGTEIVMIWVIRTMEILTYLNLQLICIPSGNQTQV